MKNKNKKNLWKKIVLIALASIVAIFAIYVIVTCVTASKIPHRYASAKEGAEIMLANTEYYENYTQNDIDFRMQKTGATLDELLDESADEVKSFNPVEKLFIESRFAKMSRTLKKNGYELPEIDEIVLVKTDMELESAASGYTHGTEIYLNSTIIATYSWLSLIPGAGNYADELLWHELFHCLTRCNPDFREQMYSLINFTVTGTEYELPSCVADKYLSNPDVEHHDSYATFVIDGREIDCYVAWITTMTYAEAQCGFNSCSTPVLIPVDGTDTYYLPEQASNFNEVFGENTGYVIDPEECMADNFKYAMYYGIEGPAGKGYPDPEIIQGVIDAVSH